MANLWLHDITVDNKSFERIKSNETFKAIQRVGFYLASSAIFKYRFYVLIGSQVRLSFIIEKGPVNIGGDEHVGDNNDLDDRELSPGDNVSL